MTKGVSRNNPEYIRILELISKITEEWGETVSAINFYHNNIEITQYLDSASKDLQGLHSLINELQALLEVVKLKQKPKGPETCKKHDALATCNCSDCNTRPQKPKTSEPRIIRET